MRTNKTPKTIQSEYCNQMANYFFVPGTWCANILFTTGTSTLVTLPDQPGLRRNVLYKANTFPLSIIPSSHTGLRVKCIYIFNLDDEEYLIPYHRTGWEFTALGPFLAGVCTVGISALVTLPVSTFLLLTKKRSTKLCSTDVCWDEDD